MSCRTNRLSCLWQLPILFAGLLLALGGESRIQAAEHGPNRYLFIVDVSSSMKKWEGPLAESLFDLVYSGVRGHMTNADSFGVWMVGETNDTSASVEVWRQKYAVELASRVGLRLKDRGCKGRPALAVALADASRVAQSVKDVTVILISNGETPIQGTPFDTNINAAVAEILPAMRRNHSTINLALIAQDGAFVGWAVNSPDFLVALPNLPPKKTLVPQAAAAPNNSPVPTDLVANVATQAASVPLAVSPPPPRVASKPIIITKETVDRDRAATRALATTDEMPFSPNKADIQERSTNAPVLEVTRTVNPTGGAAPLETNTSSAAATTVTPPPAESLPSNKSDPSPATAGILPVSTQQVARSQLNHRHAETSFSATTEPPPFSNSQAAATADQNVRVERNNGGFPLLWAGAGAGAMAALIVIAWALKRDRGSDVSLVSQAMALERIQEQRRP